LPRQPREAPPGVASPGVAQRANARVSRAAKPAAAAPAVPAEPGRAGPRPQDRLVEVGGYRLHLEVAGRGAPTVVLEAGGGTSCDTWDPLWPAVAALTRAARYDRAGLGRSEPRPHPWAIRGIVAELRALLDRAPLRPPYVLVGHSFGVQVVRVFAGTYPADVAGLVFVDGAQEDLEERMAPFLGEVGLRRWRQGWDDWLATGNPEAVNYARLPEALAGLRDEGRRLPDVPLVVLTAGSRAAREALGLDWVPVDDFLRVTREIGAETAALSPRGRHVLAGRSGHFVHHDEPELVLAAIAKVVEAARAGAAAATPPTRRRAR
jgi:pimeloyl-ACP methyl ester carboxylesterase